MNPTLFLVTAFFTLGLSEPTLRGKTEPATIEGIIPR